MSIQDENIMNSFSNMTQEIDAAPSRDHKIGVTVRLDPYQLGHVDLIASEMGQTRQWVLNQLIDTSLSSALGGIVAARTNSNEESQIYIENLNKKVMSLTKEIFEGEGMKYEAKGWHLRIAHGSFAWVGDQS
jgi:hypothetical protein